MLTILSKFIKTAYSSISTPLSRFVRTVAKPPTNEPSPKKSPKKPTQNLSKTAISKKKQDEFELLNLKRKQEKRDLIVKNNFADKIGPSALYRHKTIYLCTCKKSKKMPLCDRTHLRFEKLSPQKYAVGDIDIKESPDFLICKCGKKSTKYPICDEQTCLLKVNEISNQTEKQLII